MYGDIMVYRTRISNVICVLFRLSYPHVSRWRLSVQSSYYLKNTLHRAVMLMTLHCLVDSDVKHFTFDLCK